jgi:dephospho-CoA kinase
MDFSKDCEQEADKFIPETMAKANYHLDNNQDFAHLYKQIDSLLTKIIK